MSKKSAPRSVQGSSLGYVQQEFIVVY